MEDLQGAEQSGAGGGTTAPEAAAPGVGAGAGPEAAPIRVYDTRTRKKQPLIPLTPGEVRIYVCGVTPYDYTHVGHARVAVLWDAFRRYLRYRGYRVRLVQNFTDVDDKIIARANREGVPVQEIADRYIADYRQVMAALGVESPDVTPRVTEEIEPILDMVQALVDKGYAYAASGDVFFSVGKFAGYGQLSGRSTEEMEAGARVEVSPGKRDPLDFALWKGAKPGEPAWPSPWGPGRPGWHIECSAMARKYLGDRFDIHGGGMDLIFPHHENEIAQSQAMLGPEAFARLWVHNGMVEVAREKMSKSIGNTTAVREVLRRWPRLAVRYFLLSGHYRSPLTFSPEELDNAARGLERLWRAWRLSGEWLEAAPQASGAEAGAGATAPGAEERPGSAGAVTEAGAGAGAEDLAAQLERDFRAAMDDDLNTAAAIGVLHGSARDMNRALAQWNQQAQAPTRGQIEAVRRWRTVFATLAGGILGILPGAGVAGTAGTAGAGGATGTGAGAAGGSEAGAAGAGAAPAGAAGGLALQGAAARLQPADVAAEGGPEGDGSAGENQAGYWRRLSGQLVDVLLAVRDLARQKKNWQEADYIRDRLKELGVTVEDTPTGTRWQWAQLLRRGGGKPGESQPAERNG